MKRWALVLITIGGLILSSCQKSPLDETALDQQVIEELITTELADWFDFTPVLNDTFLSDSGIVGLNSVLTDTFPFIRGWGRIITEVSRQVSAEIRNDTAYVSVSADISGFLRIGAPDTVIEKPFTDHAQRYAVFVRTGRRDDPRRGWSLARITGTEITAENATVSIDSIRVTGGDVDTVITDALAYWDRDQVLAFPPGTEVQVTLYVNDPEQILAYLHYRDRLRRHRRPRFFYNPETGQLEGIWRIPIRPGVHHVGFDILHWSTLYVDDAPYDAHAWVFPYRVVR